MPFFWIDMVDFLSSNPSEVFPKIPQSHLSTIPNNFGCPHISNAAVDQMTIVVFELEP